MSGNSINGIHVTPSSLLHLSIYRTIIQHNLNGIVGYGIDAGITLTNTYVDLNQLRGIVLSYNAALIMRASTARNNGSADIDNSGYFGMLAENQIDTLSNTGLASSDGTNNIFNFSGNALGNLTRR